MQSAPPAPLSIIKISDRRTGLVPPGDSEDSEDSSEDSSVAPRTVFRRLRRPAWHFERGPDVRDVADHHELMPRPGRRVPEFARIVQAHRRPPGPNLAHRALERVEADDPRDGFRGPADDAADVHLHEHGAIDADRPRVGCSPRARMHGTAPRRPRRAPRRTRGACRFAAARHHDQPLAPVSRMNGPTSSPSIRGRTRTWLERWPETTDTSGGTPGEESHRTGEEASDGSIESEPPPLVGRSNHSTGTPGFLLNPRGCISNVWSPPPELARTTRAGYRVPRLGGGPPLSVHRSTSPARHVIPAGKRVGADGDPGGDQTAVRAPKRHDVRVFYRGPWGVLVRRHLGYQLAVENVGGRAWPRSLCGPIPEQRGFAVVEAEGLGVPREVRLPHLPAPAEVAADVRTLRARGLLREGRAEVAQAPPRRPRGCGPRPRSSPRSGPTRDRRRRGRRARGRGPRRGRGQGGGGVRRRRGVGRRGVAARVRRAGSSAALGATRTAREGARHHGGPPRGADERGGAANPRGTRGAPRRDPRGGEAREAREPPPPPPPPTSRDRRWRTRAARED